MKRLLFLLVLVSIQAKAAVVVNGVTTASTTSSPALTFAHTVNGADMHLIVVVHHAGEGTRSVTSITYGGLQLARIASVVNRVRVTDMWHLVAPPTGTSNVVVTMNISAAYVTGAAISRTGVDQTNPIGTPITGTGTSATPSVNVSSVAGRVVQDALTWDRFTAPQANATAGANQAQLTNQGGTFQLGGATSEESGGPIATMSWALSASRAWSMIAVEIKPASVPPPVISVKKNIIVIMTDNQDRRSVYEAMTKVQTLLGQNGATFTNAHVAYPLCCPSRSTFLTGQYAHNHHVMANIPPTGGYGMLDHAQTLPVWLQQAGYHTAHVGKYLNGSGIQDANPSDNIPACREIPPGWNEWYGNVGTDSIYYNYVLNENGTLRGYGNPAALASGCPITNTTATYQTDLYTQKALNLINSRATATDGKPFFLNLSYSAPAGVSVNGSPGPEPAPRHKNLFAGVPLPITPSFNEQDVSDKPANIRSRPLLTSGTVSTLTSLHQRRLEALLAVDEAVEQIINTLGATGQLQNTTIIFTSDQGFLMGEHRVSFLAWPYQESLQVPLIIRGPGFSPNSTRSNLVSNVDLAPTILGIAGATPALVMDGASLIPLAANAATPWRTVSFFESDTGESGGNRYNGVVDSRYVFIEHNTGEVELYDLLIDPWQLVSRHADPGYQSVRQGLKNQMDSLKPCSGATCWR